MEVPWASELPDHPLTLELLREFGGPIATTSANKSGEEPATSAGEVGAQLGNRVDLIVDGGTTFTKVASTVLNLSVSPPKILRHGGIPDKLLMEWSQRLKTCSHEPRELTLTLLTE